MNVLFGHHGPVAALVAGLSTELFVAAHFARARVGRWAVALRWLGRVARVEIDPLFQLAQSLHQLSNQLMARRHRVRQLAGLLFHGGWRGLSFHRFSLLACKTFRQAGFDGFRGVNRYHCMSSSSQIVNDPRALSAALYAAQLVGSCS